LKLLFYRSFFIDVPGFVITIKLQLRRTLVLYQ